MVLSRTSDMCERLEIDFPSYYVANRLESADARRAVADAREEVAAADVGDKEEDLGHDPHYRPRPHDYQLVCVFEGHHDVAMYDFQE